MSIIEGLSLDPNFRYSAGDPMGIDPWQNAFLNSQVLGEGMTPGTIQAYGNAADPSYWRVSRNTGGDQYQTRTFTRNPDGTFSWKGSWQDKTKESALDQLKNAGMLLGGGALGLGALGFGPAAGLFGGAGGAGIGSSATGHGAWLGEGASSGIGAWDGAMAGAGGAAGGGGLSGLFGKAGSFLTDPKNLGTILKGAGMLGGAMGGGMPGPEEYKGPMPTISREGWAPNVTPQFMNTAIPDTPLRVKKGNTGSGLWQFLGA